MAKIIVEDSPFYNRNPQWSVYNNDVNIYGKFKYLINATQSFFVGIQPGQGNAVLNIADNLANPTFSTLYFIENPQIKSYLYDDDLVGGDLQYINTIDTLKQQFGSDKVSYIFDIYQCRQDVGTILDTIEWRYGRYMYNWVNSGLTTFTGGREIKNLGRYIVDPNTNTEMSASLNISRILSAHITQFDETYESRLTHLINKTDLTRNIVYDDVNSVKWRTNWGYIVKDWNKTFVDTYYISEIQVGSYSQYIGNLGLTFSSPHGLKTGDEIVIEMTSLTINSLYNGQAVVVGTPNDYLIIVDKKFGDSSANETGKITQLIRSNESVSGDAWMRWASQYKYGGSSNFTNDPDYWFGNGFISGANVTNTSFGGVMQKKQSPSKLNQLGVKPLTIPQNLDIWNDATAAFVDTWWRNNKRWGLGPNGTCSCVNTKFRYFLSNWWDELETQKLNIYYDNNLNIKKYPNLTLGVLTHPNFWPAYDWYKSPLGPEYIGYNGVVNVDYSGYSDFWNGDPGLDLSGLVISSTDFWFDNTTLPTFTHTAVKLKDRLGNVKNTIYVPTYGDRKALDYKKLDVLALNTYLWTLLESNGAAVEGDIIDVELQKRYDDSWTVANDLNKIIDFNGFNWAYDEGELYDEFDERSQNKSTPYPFNMQWNEYKVADDSYWRMEGPYGSNQISGLPNGFDPRDYNWAPGKWVGKGFAPQFFDEGTPNYPVSYTTGNIMDDDGQKYGYWKGSWWSLLKCNFTDDVPVDYHKIYMTRLNDIDLIPLNGNPNISENLDRIDAGFPCFPAGEYEIDYLVRSVSFTDVMDVKWGIGNDEISLTLNGGIDIVMRDTLFTNGGNMYFSVLVDPAPGDVVIEPIRIRYKTNLTIAKKSYEIKTPCNPYVQGLDRWDSGSAITLVFLNRLGAYERFDFIYDTKKTSTITRNQMAKAKKTDQWGGKVISDGSLTNYNISINESYIVNSDWISQVAAEWLDELITSPKVFIEIDKGWDNYTTNYGQNYQLIPVVIDDSQYTYKTTLRDKLFNLQLTFRLSDNITIS